MKRGGIKALILGKMEETINKFQMLKKGDRVLVAFSAGPDSTALLYLLYELRDKYRISLFACHLNHMLRGEESLEDEKEAKKKCDMLGVPCRVVKKDVRRLKETGESLEEAGRRIRYQVLQEIAHYFKANKIALGHNRDDHVETVLLRLIRGTGEEGLSGMPEKRKLGENLYLIRPLIEIERAKIEEYLQSEKISFRIDSSNLDIRLLRNRIRYRLIPHLKRYNPKIRESLLKIACISRENSRYIQEECKKILERASVKLGDALRVDINELRAYPTIVRNQVIREAIRQFRGNLRNLDFSHAREINKLIDSRKANLVALIGRDLKIEREYNFLYFRKVRATDRRGAGTNFYSYVLTQPGRYPIPEIDKTVEIEYLSREGKITFPFGDQATAYFDGDRIKFPLILRNRRAGDRFSPFGMKGKKKVKDFFIDEKIPLKERDRIPILTTEDGQILWIVGYRRSNAGIITSETSNVLKVKVSDSINKRQLIEI